MPKTLDDNSLMPFGKHKGTKMANVPDSYLVWLRDNASVGVRTTFPEVFEYIEDNEDVIKG